MSGEILNSAEGDSTARLVLDALDVARTHHQRYNEERRHLLTSASTLLDRELIITGLLRNRGSRDRLTSDSPEAAVVDLRVRVIATKVLEPDGGSPCIHITAQVPETGEVVGGLLGERYLHATILSTNQEQA